MQLSVLFDGVSMWIVADTDAVNHITARTCIYLKYALLTECTLYIKMYILVHPLICSRHCVCKQHSSPIMAIIVYVHICAAEVPVKLLCVRVHVYL
jgi:hypothetical protein